MSLSNHDWREVIKILDKFGFRVVRQKGSHMILQNDKKELVVVPKQKPLKRGLLEVILDQAGISKQEFLQEL